MMLADSSLLQPQPPLDHISGQIDIFAEYAPLLAAHRVELEALGAKLPTSEELDYKPLNETLFNRVIKDDEDRTLHELSIFSGISLEELKEMENELSLGDELSEEDKEQILHELSEMFGISLKDLKKMEADSNTPQRSTMFNDAVTIYINTPNDRMFDKEKFLALMHKLQEILPPEAIGYLALNFLGKVEPTTHLLDAFERDRLRLGQPARSDFDTTLKEVFSSNIKDPNVRWQEMHKYERSLTRILPNGLKGVYQLEQDRDNGMLSLFGACSWEIERQPDQPLTDVQINQMARFIIQLRQHALKSLEPPQTEQGR